MMMPSNRKDKQLEVIEAMKHQNVTRFFVQLKIQKLGICFYKVSFYIEV